MLTTVGMFQSFVQKTYEFHHDHRSDGNTDIILFALVLYKVAEYIGTHTFSYVRTIVCGYVQIADSRHFFLENNEIFCLCSDNGVSSDSMLMQPF